ncbi:MAG: phytoene/squalene synthase family protein [Sphingopyxis sp.]|nr:phytoene/squalene synthase family protein [Sphingopyxis sp.]
MFGRAALVAHARDSIARGSKSFALASKLFDRVTRERVWLLYGWCRACDDLADGQDHGGAMGQVADPAARLAEIRDKTAAAYAGQVTGDPAFDGLTQLLTEVAIPQHFADDVIAGFALDAADWHPRTEDDLLQYCYHVAGAVGCMMAVVMGVAPDDDDVLDRACDLGLAFQLANIARDVGEDAAAGRCYLPDDWLSELDIPPGQVMHPAYRPRLAQASKWLADMAEEYEASARVGTAALSFRSAWAVQAAAGIYGDIAREVRARGAAAWDARVVTTRGQKLGHMWTGIRAAMGRGRIVGAARSPGLWRRERNSQRFAETQSSPERGGFRA